MKIGFEAKRVFHNKTGLGNYSRDLVRLLSRLYPKNDYFLYNPKASFKNLFVANNVTIFEKQPTTRFYKKFYNLWRQKGIISDLKKDGITIFHGLSGEIPRGLEKNNIKSVVTIHDLIFLKIPHLYSFFDRKIHFYKFKKAAKEANCIIAISEQTKQDIIDYLKINPSKIKVIYQGCHAIFKEVASKEQLQQTKIKFQLPDKFILNVGTIEERKNIFLAIKAILGTNMTLVIVGKQTSYSSKIKSFIANNKMEHQVLFLNQLTLQELATIYQLASVFVYPSIYEGFGIPITEALYSKTPVITTNSGVFPEAGGPFSIYIDPTNEKELQNKLLFLWNNIDFCTEIAQKGHEFVQKFNDEIIASQLMEVYKNL